MKQFSICVVGGGYVGFPLAFSFLKSANNSVKIYDIDAKKVKCFKSGKSYLSDYSNEEMQEFSRLGGVITNNLNDCSECNVYILAVPTPLDSSRAPDLQYLKSALRDVSSIIESGDLISVESTTYPGTTRSLVTEIFAEKKNQIGKDIHICYSPEREDPGKRLTSKYSVKNIPKVISGWSEKSLQLGLDMYGVYIDNLVTVDNLELAELTKCLENTYRAVNIGLVNELKLYADKLGLDLNKAIDAAATKPFGFTAFRPGPGLGGHCIPVDPFYLSWHAKTVGIDLDFIEHAGRVNSQIPHFIIEKISNKLNQLKKCLNGSRVFVLGIAYKPDVNDIRESPAIKIISKLREKGSNVDYNDSYIRKVVIDREEFCSKEINQKTLENYDLILMLTNHSYYNEDDFSDFKGIIVDTRNFFKKLPTVLA